MSSYENPQIRDGINVAPHSALGEFVQLSLALVIGVVLLVAAVVLGFRWLAPLIPFSWEQRLAAPVVAQLAGERSSPQVRYLQELAEQLASQMDFPPDMQVQVHYSPQNVPNAFATLGGHVTLYQGVIERVDSENALAMVLAHELAHIRHRDPLVSAGSGVLVTLALGTVLGSGAESVVGRSSAAMAQLRFSREQERRADAAALEALRVHYGHTRGADAFFKAMLLGAPTVRPRAPEFLQTHPDTEARIAAMHTAAQNGPADAPLTPLPAFLRTPPAQ